MKLGAYAIIRLLLFSLYDIPYEFILMILVIGLISFLHASFSAFCQIDIKKIIAYSSVAHMNFSILGLFSYSILGLLGFYYLMFGHAITSSALFLGIGVLYDRYKTRLIFYYNTCFIFMPIFAFLFLILILSNFGFPGTCNFVGELLILAGMSSFSILLILFSIIGSFYTLIYSLCLYNKIFFGPCQQTFIRYYSDITRLEFFILGLLVLLVFILGFFPFIVFEYSMLGLMKLFIVTY